MLNDEELRWSGIGQQRGLLGPHSNVGSKAGTVNGRTLVRVRQQELARRVGVVYGEDSKEGDDFGRPAAARQLKRRAKYEIDRLGSPGCGPWRSLQRDTEPSSPCKMRSGSTDLKSVQRTLLIETPGIPSSAWTALRLSTGGPSASIFRPPCGILAPGC